MRFVSECLCVAELKCFLRCTEIGFFHARLACSLVSLNPNQQHYDKHIIEDSKGHLIYLNHPTLNMIPHDEYCLEYNEDDQEVSLPLGSNSNSTVQAPV